MQSLALPTWLCHQRGAMYKKNSGRKESLLNYLSPMRHFWNTLWSRSLLLIMRSWRFQGIDLPKGPVILSSWHQDLPAAFALIKELKPMAMLSRSRDGLRLSPLFEEADWKIAYGSSSRQPTAIRQLLNHLKSGHSVAMALDGPRGPARRAQPGTQWLSEKSGVSTVLLEFRYHSSLRLRTWDKMVIPLPFSRIDYQWSYL